MTQPSKSSAIRPLYLIDLDRTAFNTDRFVADLIDLMVRHFQLDRSTYLDTMKLYVHQHELGYDFFAHIHSLTGQTAAAVQEVVDEAFGPADYTYADVPQWLAHQTTVRAAVAVLTVGVPNYQQLKLSHAGALSELPSLIVGRNKGHLIHDVLAGIDQTSPLATLIHDAGRPLAVIDDNPRTFEALTAHPQVSQWLVARPSERYSGQSAPPHVVTITSFTELP